MLYVATSITLNISCTPFYSCRACVKKSADGHDSFELFVCDCTISSISLSAAKLLHKPVHLRTAGLELSNESTHRELCEMSAVSGP